jgi:alanyl-tRNA synthetase
MKTKDIRKAFLQYFEEQSHLIVQSSSLVPHNDPSLLFTNAGMVPFKNAFLGLEQPPGIQVASSQRCMRAGGKHNDLENVGYTARHHTFFEMLGNFSFGSYFKAQAIHHAFHFLTKVLKIPVERLWITVFEEDQEAEDLWINTMGIDPARLSRCGTTDNFWSMGDTGPCGPCSEIYYDHGSDIPGGPPGSADAEGDRYVEIWNLVFMQYNRDASGTLHPLPKPAVDTGMGLERIAAVMQGVHNNYDIDIFANLIQSIKDLIGVAINPMAPVHSLRVVADHIRSCAFLIADGVLPSNEGRGYVLRRIIRRAVRHGHAIGFKEPFFYYLVDALVAQMGDDYPVLAAGAERIKKALYQEELQFAHTLDKGLKILEEALASAGGLLPGAVIFKLYDTYGFPVDLTNDIARERGITLDTVGFEQAMEEQRTRSRDHSGFTGNPQLSALAGFSRGNHVTGFIGYEDLETKTPAVVEDLLRCKMDPHQSAVAPLKEGERLLPGEYGEVILDHTPFYAEAGGQVGDSGALTWGTESSRGYFAVRSTRKVGTAYAHHGLLEKGSLGIGDKVQATVDKVARAATARNHSATHLLHAVLRKVLGDHVQQKGSLVDSQRLRFDFSHGQALSAAQLAVIEQQVNQKILENTLVETKILPVEEALKQGAIALFGEKYSEEVRVLSMGDYFSVELCGGTHAQRTGDIGCCKIISESGIASGVRRLEALTGEAALAYCNTLEKQLSDAAERMRATRDTLPDKITELLAKNRSLEKELQQAKKRLVTQGSEGGDASPPAIRLIQGKKVLAVKIAVGDQKTLKEYAEHLRDQWDLSVVVVAGMDSEDAPKVQVVALVAKVCTPALQAHTLLKHVLEQLGGQGGGRADLAQGAGKPSENLMSILGSVYNFVEKALESVAE